MNTADLARLELAKRAYQAVQPDVAEVQTGVRRARLALRRPKPRRRWLSKGLVIVVLAVGSLAYAKPHALAELVEKVLPADRASRKPTAGLRGALTATQDIADTSASHRGKPIEPVAASAPEATPLQGINGSDELTPTRATPPAALRADAAKPSQAVPPAPVGSRSAALDEASTFPAKPLHSRAFGAASAVSNWGRVGQALARGDETQALAALSELSESDDQPTRDKADLGRAQLFMAHGDRDEACSLARSLTNRSVGSRIERQAQSLLKSCRR